MNTAETRDQQLSDCQRFFQQTAVKEIVSIYSISSEKIENQNNTLFFEFRNTKILLSLNLAENKIEVGLYSIEHDDKPDWGSGASARGSFSENFDFSNQEDLKEKIRLVLDKARREIDPIYDQEN